MQRAGGFVERLADRLGVGIVDREGAPAEHRLAGADAQQVQEATHVAAGEPSQLLHDLVRQDLPPVRMAVVDGQDAIKTVRARPGSARA
ncbi:hypothetical protein [Accumulibacter sp.]|uniref:hypothetical protein n=1 Tax=Accumulibacter sp. TaxID=2053492 RepID=UPI0025FDC7AC|nr:hypothetical protein [Accumulibacter sp.]MCM8611160.1 hypothetical protein [Accumulibacter sp.]MCM8636274.1 hypothetical protein [Accumulibacter sp.]MCM8638485.1 hypothetical protein [Accumulibacter sp.]